MTIQIYKFNNYYNRIVRRHNDVSGYGEPLGIFENINFNPNDGISAEQILNYGGEIPDYMLVLDEYGNINSRWFVMDSQRTRAMQFRMTLFRDTLADWYDDVVAAPMFVEKATLDIDNPLIYNNENMSYNQIKKEEILLKDGTKCPWIVGYYAKNTATEYLSGTVDANDLDKSYDELITTTFAAWKYNATTTPYTGLFDTLDYRVYAMQMTASIGFQSQQGYLLYDRYGNYVGWNYVAGLNTPLSANFRGPMIGTELQPKFQAQNSYLASLVPNYVAVNSESDVRKFLNYNGKVIKDTEGKYYSITIIKSDEVDEGVVDIQSGNLFNAINGIVSQSEYMTGTANTSSYKVYYSRPKYTMLATELTGLETTWDMSGEKLITDDAPYNIFAIPYGDTYLEYLGNLVAKSNAVIGMAVANSIIRTMGDNLYDIQLLPYCPVSTPFGNGVLQMYDTDAYSLVKTPGGEALENHVSYILNVPKSKFSRNLEYKIDAPKTAIEKKVSNECDKYRISSPNYNGYFDFSVAKNNGVDYFNVDCVYKPYQPYIHVNPNFKNLYGADYDDARGLICGGDFSLTQIKDSWQQYQIQNKNYQEIFSRQIENMEVNNRLANIQQATSVAVGTLSGAAGGAALSSMVGGASLLGGAIGGAGMSLAGGLADIYLTRQMQAEAMDYTKDLYGYNLGNIQALPYTLTKVSSFNNNNKVFPFIEYYTCTDVEKDALRNKIKYNGMTVGVIGKMEDYITDTESYIKGQLIRLDTIIEDYHVINVISQELYKGVYV